jgi:peptidoglycan/xylan/chitin deacetylase (PgdA/CDA1 family)
MEDYSDDVPFWDVVAGRAIVVMPYALDSNDMKMWVAPAFTPEQWLAYAVDTFDVLYDEGAVAPRMMSLGVHLRIIGRPGRIGAFERFIQHARSRPRVWIATRQQIVERWAAAHPRPGEGGR